MEEEDGVTMMTMLAMLNGMEFMMNLNDGDDDGDGDSDSDDIHTV